MPEIVDTRLRDTDVKVYDAIREAFLAFGVAPSTGELIKAVGVSEIATRNAVNRLVKCGHLKKIPYKVRGIRIVDIDRELTREVLMPWDRSLDEPEIWDEIINPPNQ